VALALGLRQGEALGLRWQHVNLDTATLTVRWQLQRLAWRHGCPDPHACGKSHHWPSCSPYWTAHALFRGIDGRPHLSYEAGALRAVKLNRLRAGWLDALLPVPLADVLDREQAEREQLRALPNGRMS
jgi:integrase